MICTIDIIGFKFSFVSPGNLWEAYSDKGLAYLELDETEKAYENIWLGLNKSDFKKDYAWFAKAIYHFNTNDLDKATETISKAYELDSEDINNSLFRGYILCKKRDLESALQYFEHVLEKEAGHPLAILGKGLVYFNEGNLDEAKKLFLSAIKDQDRLKEATRYYTPSMLIIFNSALSAASHIGIDIETFKIQPEYQDTWALRYFKKPTPIKYKKSTRFVPPDEPLIVDLDNNIIIKPYPGVKVKPSTLVEGQQFHITGSCKTNNDYYQIKMDVIADATIVDLSIFGGNISPDAVEWIAKPSFQKRYSFNFELPVGMPSKSFPIVIITESNQSHKFDIHIQGSEITAKKPGKELIDEL